MATNVFQASAQAIAQVDAITITANDVATTYKVTMGAGGGKVVSVVGDPGGANNTAANLQAALAASTFPEFQEVGWTVAGAVITPTASTPGVPFTLTTSVSGGAGTMSHTTLTPSSGPADWSSAGNWSTGSVPVTGDDVWVLGNNPIRYGLAQASVALNSLNITGAMVNDTGNPLVNPNGYWEYRPTDLNIGATTANIGQGPGGGSSRTRLNIAGNTTVNVYATAAAAADQPNGALILKGGGAASVVNLYLGVVGLATDPGSTFNCGGGLNVGFTNSRASDVTLTVGQGTTLGPVSMDGGQVLTYVGGVVWKQYGGTAVLEGTAGLTSTTLLPPEGTAATFRALTTGNLNATLLGPRATLDASGDARTKAIGTVSMMPNATLYDPDKTLNGGGTLNITCIDCGPDDLNLTLGRGVSLART